MQSRRWVAGLAVGVALLLALAGCGGSRSQGGGADPTATAEAPVATPVPAETQVPVDTAPPADYAQVAIPDAGLQVDVPAGWQQQDGVWMWQPVGEDEIGVGVTWSELQPSQEPEAALLPEGAVVLQSEPIELEIGGGRRFLVEVYAPAAEGSDQQAPVASVELHALVVSVREGRRVAYDLYATAPTQEALSSIEPALERLVTSATFLDAPDAPAGDVPLGSGEVSQVAANKARAILARHLRVTEGAIELVGGEYVEWPDGCLGIQLPDRACTQVIVPGYRIIFEVNGERYEVRTDAEGDSTGIVP